MVAKQRETPNRLMEHRSRQAGWMVAPDNAEEAASDVVADAFGAILAAFAEERAEPPKALVKLLERTRAGITKELCRLIKTWRPETTTAGKVRRGAGRRGGTRGQIDNAAHKYNAIKIKEAPAHAMREFKH